jgi:uncharacterized protein YuzE
MREAELLVTASLDTLDVDGFPDTVGYLRFSDEPVYETLEWHHQVYADMDIEGRIVGIEILDARMLPFINELCFI